MIAYYGSIKSTNLTIVSFNLSCWNYVQYMKFKFTLHAPCIQVIRTWIFVYTLYTSNKNVDFCLAQKMTQNKWQSINLSSSFCCIADAFSIIKQTSSTVSRSFFFNWRRSSQIPRIFLIAEVIYTLKTGANSLKIVMKRHRELWYFATMRRERSESLS